VGKLHEVSDILAHHQGSLLQILELLLLELDDTLRYVMISESLLELIPVDGVGFFMSFYICVPGPVSWCETSSTLSQLSHWNT
jgi:hypothetical protein